MGRGTSQEDPWRLSHSGNEYLVASTVVRTQSPEHAKACAKTSVDFPSRGSLMGPFPEHC